MHMSKILIPMAVFDEKNYFQTHGIRTSYLKKIFKYGIEPVFLSPKTPMNLVEKYYQECAGILLVGGQDINPSYYASKIESETKIDDPARDEIEIFLTKSALKDKKPFLGICRGSQILNVALGGTLIQNVPNEFPNEKHGLSEGGNYDNLRDEKSSHKINIIEDSKLYKLLGKKEVTVPCGHHQSIDKLGNNLKLVAVSPAGVVEGIEHTDQNYFCLGVQFHPEVYEGGELESIFTSFFDAVEKTKLI